LKNETLKPSAVNPQSAFLSLQEDFASWHQSEFLARDFAYLIDRYNKEGFPFLAITMPLMGKALELGLISGRFNPPAGWRLKKNTRLPIIFNYLFKKIFDDVGYIIDDKDSASSVFLLRQLFLYWSRSDSSNMKDTDTTIQDFLGRISRSRNYPVTTLLLKNNKRVSEVLSGARKLLHTIFDRNDPRMDDFHKFCKEPWGRHGPGAVAGKESAVEKWNFVKYPQTPNILFRYSDMDTRPIPIGPKIPVSRVICVPKDFRGPRVICIEPKEMQFAQQGLMRLLMAHTHKHSLTRRSINFDSVETSRKLCYDLRFATIDLKDASDNISLNLVKWLFPRWIYRLLVRYRTPLIENVRSGCFATMGSALCFPIQTLVFWALSQSTVNLCSQAYRQSIRLTRVFGDDIIVPTRFAHTVCDVLTAVGLKVNASKTCIMTPARESCGEWVYKNISVYCIRPRVHKLSSYYDWLGIREQAKLAERLGLFNFSKYLKKLVDEFYTPRERWCRNLQRPELRLPFFTGKHHKLDGYDGLYAYHTQNNLNPFSTGQSLRLKWRWAGCDS
jgi:hypothetical protein